MHDFLVAICSHKIGSDKTVNANLACFLTSQLPVSYASSVLLISAVCIKKQCRTVIYSPLPSLWADRRLPLDDISANQEASQAKFQEFSTNPNPTRRILAVVDQI